MVYPTLKELGQLPYAKQCAFFINGMWAQGIEKDCNLIYTIYEKFVELDKRGVNGNELDEFDAHRLLEAFDETLSVKDMRETMKLIDQDFNTMMSIVEYLTYKFGKTVQEVCESPQGDNTAAIEAAQRKLQQVMDALAEVEAKLEVSKQAVAESTEAHDKAQHEENVLRGLEAELQAAVGELERIEQEMKDKKAALEAMVADVSIGAVKRGRSANELEQLRSEDPLPLRKAKITQEAALRKVTKQKVMAEISTKKAASTKAAAEEAKAELARAYVELENQMSEATAGVEEAKSNGGEAHGDFYFIERSLFIADKSLPNKRQKYDHSKPFKYTSE